MLVIFEVVIMGPNKARCGQQWISQSFAKHLRFFHMMMLLDISYKFKNLIHTANKHLNKFTPRIFINEEKRNDNLHIDSKFIIPMKLFYKYYNSYNSTSKYFMKVPHTNFLIIHQKLCTEPQITKNIIYNNSGTKLTR